MTYDPASLGGFMKGPGAGAVVGATTAGAKTGGYTAARAGAKPANSSGVRACCSCVILKDKIFEVPAIALRQRHHPKSTMASSLKSSEKRPWGAEIMIDGTAGVIYVTHRLLGVNYTGKKDISGNILLMEAKLQSYFPAIIQSIRKVWNAKPYRLEITDTKCHKSYRVEFNPVFVTSNPHFTIAFINSPFKPDGRSSVLSSAKNGTATFNLNDSRSVKRAGSRAILEAHEFGHMLGLNDEYLEFEDHNRDGDGMDLSITDPASLDASGKPKRLTTVNNPQADWRAYNRTKSALEKRVGHGLSHDWETDRGGMQYTWPKVTGLPPEASPNVNGLMGKMKERTASRRPYIITVVYAVIETLRANGRNVTAMKIKA